MKSVVEDSQFMRTNKDNLQNQIKEEKELKHIWETM